jgi:hypothetical protein
MLTTALAVSLFHNPAIASVINLTPKATMSVGWSNGQTYNCCARYAGNDGASPYQAIAWRFFERFSLPDIELNSTLTSAILDFTGVQPLYSTNPLALYGTDGKPWTKTTWYAQPYPTTGILGHLPFAKGYYVNFDIRIDVTDYLNSFYTSATDIGFMVKSLNEWKNWTEVMKFSAESLTLTFTPNAPTKDSPGSSHPLPEPNGMIAFMTSLVLLGHRVYSRRNRRERFMRSRNQAT